MNYNKHRRKKANQWRDMNINWSNEVYQYYHATTDQAQQQSQLNISKYQSIEYPFRHCYFLSSCLKHAHSSYSMAFKSYRGSWSGRKQLGNCSRIWTKRVHGMTVEKRPGDYSFWRAENVCKTCNDGPFHSEISWTRPASDGVVFTAKRTRLVFTFLIWNLKCLNSSVYRLSVRGRQRLWLVRNTLLSWQLHNMSRKECCSHESTVNSHED